LRGLGYSCLTIWQCELDNESRIKHKLFKFLSTAHSRTGHATVTEQTPKSKVGAPTYRVNVKDQYVSRVVSLNGGKPFETRRNIVSGVSLKQDPRSLYDQVYLRSPEPPSHPPLRGNIRVADLFSGCGGLSLGAREATTAIGKEFQPILAIDEDEPSLSVYERNFKPPHGVNDDIWKVLTGEVGDRLRAEEKNLIKKIGGIDLCLAGPPCQGHSDLNNHTRRKDKRNQLYERVARFAEVACPSHILIENVPTIIHGKDRALDKTVKRLEKL